MKNHLARQSLVAWWAAALLHFKCLGQAAVVGHRNFHADIRNAGGQHLGRVGCSNQDVIQISQNHHQVLPGGGHAIRTTPMLLRSKNYRLLLNLLKMWHLHWSMIIKSKVKVCCPFTERSPL